MKLNESPLFWPVSFKKGVMSVLDETLVPEKLKYISVRTSAAAVEVISEMKTRAFGQFLVVLYTFLLEIEKMPAVKKADFKKQQKILKKIQDIAEMLNKSRPTFPFAEVTGIIVRWAVMAIDSGLDIQKFVKQNIVGYLESIRAKRLERVQRIADIIRDGDSILTHCNVSGELAMAAALCKQEKKKIKFYATETRPYFQGAKLTVWEIMQMGGDVTLIADNAVADVMARRMVNKVIVGSDRSCANGDFANKIGTYQIAVAANHYQIPFYVLTQPSDKIRSGRDIPIEIRKPDELLKFNGKKIWRGDVEAFYPGFDVVPHDLIRESIPIGVQENE